MKETHAADIKKSHGEKVEQKLQELQNNHALCVHIWQDFSYGGYPPPVFSTLQDSNNPIPIKDRIINHPAYSMSLFPSKRSGFSIHTFTGAHNDCYAKVGYLFDMTQNNERSAKVLRAFPKNLSTGDKYDNKKFQYAKSSLITDLDRLYGQFDYDEKKILNHAQNNNFTTKQLDALGGYYENIASGKQDVRNSFYASSHHSGNAHIIVGHNEIIAIADKEHIAAIVIPVNNEDYNENLLKFHGAIRTLSHIEQGIDVPLVFYHIDGRNIGNFEYIGHGKQELKKIALNSLKNLDKNSNTLSYFSIGQYLREEYIKDEYNSHSLTNSAQEILGIDINKPLGEQKTAVAKLEKEIRECQWR